jgi:hypothetical protein
MKIKKRYYFAAAVIICAVVVFTAAELIIKKKPAAQKSVTFKLEKTFGAELQPKEAMLSRAFGTATDEQKNLYLMDNNERLVSFAPDGSLRWVISKKGKGPGDIEDPRGFATDGVKYLYLANVNGTRIDKLDLNGKYISSTAVSNIRKDYVSIAGFIKPNILVATKPLMGKMGYEVLLLKADNEFVIGNQFTIDKTGAMKLHPQLGLGFAIGVLDDNIVAGAINSYELSFHSVEGKKVKEIKKEVKNLFLAFSVENSAGCAGSISLPFKIAGNYYLCALMAPSNVTEMKQLADNNFKREYTYTIDIFNEAGESVYSIKNEGTKNKEIGRTLYSDSDGYLYTFKELPYPQVCKYKVIIEDKK